MSIEFSCPSCRQLVRTPAGTAGKKGKCPSCGSVVQIPLEVAVVSSTPSPRLVPPIHASPSPRSTPHRATPSPLHESPNGSIEFYCQACGQLVRAPSRTAGKKGKCPNCQVVTQIPATSKTPSPAGKVEVGLDWLDEPTEKASRWRDSPRQTSSAAPNKRSSQDTVVDELPELVPLIEPEPPPVGNLWDELTPADKSRPLDDHIPTLAELGPVPDPVFGLPLTPPGTPVVAATAVESGKRRFFSDANRRGLPWERDPSLDNFTQTVSYVCSAPQDAFQTMRRHDGIANPMCFFVVAVVLGISLVMLQWLIVLAGLLYSRHGPNADWERFFISFGILSVSQLMGATIGAAIGGFIAAGLYHVALMLLGGARCGYEATYRVMAFGLGSVYMLVPIPLVGPIFALVMYFVVLTYGFKQAHETTGGRAFLAVILPHVVAVFLAISLVVLVILPALIHAGR